MLPIPLTDVPPLDCHSLARKRIGIPEDQVVLATVGRAEKYLPYQGTSFVRTGLQILEDNPRAHLYIVGVSPAFAETRLGSPRHDRLHFLGYVEDPSAYQQAADVYLESFPFGSQTALLEAALAGVPSVRSYDPPVQWLTANDDAINSLMSVPATEDEYIAEASRLIRDAETRSIIGHQLRENMLAMHTGSGWVRQLHKVYDTLRTVRHTPRSIPTMRAELDSVDSALSSWQESQHPRSWEPLDDFEKYTRGGDAPSSLASSQTITPCHCHECEALQRHDFRTSRGVLGAV
jgi:lipid A disaccharide synthetase